MPNYALATAGNTPAQLLYQQWGRALTDYNGHGWHGSIRAIRYGDQRDMGISFTDANEISFGSIHGRKSMYPSLRVRSNGEFALNHPFYGWQDRSRLCQETFLGWEWEFSQYNWMYDPNPVNGRRYRTGVLKDLSNPRHYIRALLIPTDYRRNGLVWLQLVPEPGDAYGWKIALARDENTAVASSGTNQILEASQADFDDFEVLRQRRYRRMERERLIRLGLLDHKGRTIKSKDELRKERLETAATLGAHFTVDVPARTNSLRKNQEEGLWPPSGCP